LFFDSDIKGDRLPPGTVCLTYDDGPGESDGDGPGPHTRELGRYLRDEGIAAAFFVVGRHAERHRDSVAALHAWGHLVGNHTESHPGLVALAESGGDVVGELERTEAILRPIAPSPWRFFRAPYGNWRQTVDESPGVRRDRPDSIVAAILNASGRFPRVVGPVNWDICAEDWECWRLGVDPEEAARRYVAEVDRVGRGIVLLHDSSEDVAMRPRNQTYLMTRALVPALKRRGYRFVRLDDVPEARTAALVRSQVVLSLDDGRPLALDPAGGDAIAPDDAPAAARIPFGVVPLREGRFALRARNGLFLSAPDAGPLTATGERAGPRESFAIEDLGAAGPSIRCAGGYLALIDTPLGPRLASTPRRVDRLALAVEPVHAPRPLGTAMAPMP
jgi:peptidoglycan/xylan/chitin deacetylase (PgdA/CDA1 family)